MRSQRPASRGSASGSRSEPPTRIPSNGHKAQPSQTLASPSLHSSSSAASPRASAPPLAGDLSRAEATPPIATPRRGAGRGAPFAAAVRLRRLGRGPLSPTTQAPSAPAPWAVPPPPFSSGTSTTSRRSSSRCAPTTCCCRCSPLTATTTTDPRRRRTPPKAASMAARMVQDGLLHSLTLPATRTTTYDLQGTSSYRQHRACSGRSWAKGAAPLIYGWSWLTLAWRRGPVGYCGVQE